MDLQTKLIELKQKLKQTEADYHAISGAIQFCEQLIQEQEKEKEKEGKNENG